MAVAITHNFVSGIADDPGHPEWVRPSNWNAQHTFTGAANAFLGFSASGLPSDATKLFQVSQGNVMMWAFDPTSATASYSSASTSMPVVNALDFRWTNGEDGNVTFQQSAPMFYVTYNPINATDNHTADACGLEAVINNTGTNDSLSPGGFPVMKRMVGGKFASIRNTGGSANPSFGVQGFAIAGDTNSNIQQVGDGFVGGYFASLLNVMTGGGGNSTRSYFFDFAHSGQSTGLQGEIVNLSGFSTLPVFMNVAVAGRARVEGGRGTAVMIGGWFSAMSATGSLSSLCGNAYGIWVDDIQPTTNLNMAINTGVGKVQFGDVVTFGSSFTGNLNMVALAQPLILSVDGGANGQFGTPSNSGTKTYSYVVVARLASGQTSQASTVGTTTHGFDDLSQTNQNNVIRFNPVVGAVGGYDVYRTVAGGTTTNTTGKIGNAPQNTLAQFPYLSGDVLGPLQSPGFVDSGQTGDATTAPSTNTTGFIRTSAYAANGAVATVLGSVGPTGSHTTVQKWLQIYDAGGNPFYIPCF